MEVQRETWTPAPTDDEPQPPEHHALIWGDLRVTDYEIVEWRGETYMANTDHDPYGDTSWVDEYGGRFVACFEAGLEKTPAGDICISEQDFAQVSLPGRIARLYVDADGYLYADICTGTVEVLELLNFDVSLHRGFPRRDGLPQELNGHTLFCIPECLLLNAPVGDISQVTKIDDISGLDMDVWGDALKGL